MANFSMNTPGTVMGPLDSRDAIERASVLIDRAEQADSSFLELSTMLQINQSTQMKTISGLQDHDYPSLSDPQIGLASLKELSHIKHVPLPPELTEQFGYMQCSSMMGLMPEISRAWLAIDSDIFVWNYEDGSDLAYFDGLSETILCAGLVYPKPGIFQPHIQYLLCLATAMDIVLLGVSFANPNEGSVEFSASVGTMHLLPEPLFSLPADNLHVKCIESTDNGRIFLGGQDGCLYEIHYQAEDGWFSRKCKKINHSTSPFSFMVPSFLNMSYTDDGAIVQISIDNSRNILYLRSERGGIKVFDFGTDGKGLGRVAENSIDTIKKNASRIANKVEASHFQCLVNISAIPITESTSIHVLAVTDTGARLYFSTSHRGGRPNHLTLVHVRLPPGMSASGDPRKPQNVHLAHYKRGTLLLGQLQAGDNGLMWCISPDSFPFRSNLMETFEIAPIQGKIWAIAEVPRSHHLNKLLGDRNKPEPPLVVTQHMEPPRKFVIVNSSGSFIYNKLNPVDQLKDLLSSNHGPDCEDVASFFKLHKVDQACATCLILACSSVTQADQEISEWATRAFFTYGGESDYTIGSMPSQGLPLSPITNGSGRTNFLTPGSQQFQMSTPYVGNQQSITGGTEVRFSGKHDGLCLYLARIMRPYWQAVMVVRHQHNEIHSSYNSVVLGWFLEDMKSLKDFMDKNSQFASPLMAESYVVSSLTQRHGISEDPSHKKMQAEARTQEKSSLQQIQNLINRVCESLGLWKMVCDHQFHLIVARLTKDQQNALKNMKFRQFVTEGKEIIEALIQALIKCHLDDNAVTDAISCKLREICPSFYSPDDAKCSKADEMQQLAKSTQNPREREDYLRKALDLYKQIPLRIDIASVCQQFLDARFFIGIVDLSLAAASKRDPQGLALHFYKNGQPADDKQGLEGYYHRKSCYSCITSTLRYLMTTTYTHPQAMSLPDLAGPPPPRDPTRLTNAEAEQYTEQMFSLSLKSEDEMFHIHLYEWLVEMNLSERLLEINSTFLEPFLKRLASSQADQVENLDLLWKYFEKNRDFSAAAKILAKLAERQGSDLTLAQRLEYLSRATMTAKGSTMKTDGEFLHELEEKMEVARLQLQIYENLNSKFPKDRPEVQHARARLNTELMDISTLYEEFANKFDMVESKLSIIQCAGYFDPMLVENLWTEIVQRELKKNEGANVQSQMNLLGQKLTTLGRIYSGSDRFFPLSFLVKFLEKTSCEKNFSVKFVYQTLLEIGIPLIKLQDIYDRLFKSKDPCWQASRKQYHLLFVLSQLLNSFVESPTLVPNYERRHFTITALDSVAGYQVELSAAGTSDLRTLMEEFKGLQAGLDRLLKS